MAEYLMAVHMVDGDPEPPAETIQEMYAAVDVFNKKLRDQGQWVFAGGLQEPSTATVVRTENGKTITTDGPFAEAKEQLGGFWVVDVPDRDAALKLAAEASAACQGPVEVRPFQSE